MKTQIIKQGDFTLKYFKYYDIYSLFYKDNPEWGGEFNELFETQIIDRVFKLEPDPEKATEFIVELYNWLSSQQEAFGKLLDEVYEEEKQKILDEFHEEKIKILDEFYEEKQKILDEQPGTLEKMLEEDYGENKQSKDIK